MGPASTHNSGCRLTITRRSTTGKHRRVQWAPSMILLQMISSRRLRVEGTQGVAGIKLAQLLCLPDFGALWIWGTVRRPLLGVGEVVGS